MIADKYPNDKERSKIMGITMGGIAVGVLSMNPEIWACFFNYVFFKCMIITSTFYFSGISFRQHHVRFCW